MATLNPPSSMPPNVSGQYDKKTSLMIMVGVIVLLIFGLALPLVLVFWPEYEQEQLLRTGTAAPGVILSIDPTGNIVNDQPQADVRVRVTPTEGEPFEATATMIINPVYIPQFQPGKRVIVRYDPEDHTKIAIEETEETMQE